MKTTPLYISATALFGSLLASSAALAGAGGIITSGSDGWNQDNVSVKFFDAAGNEVGTMAEGVSYESYIYDRNSADVDAIHMGTVVAKDPPVGIHPGVKVVNGDTKVKTGDPENCIISSAFLEDADGTFTSQTPVTCSSDFQTHKRYKALMLPDMIDGVDSESIDMVFNVEPDAAATDPTRPYTVFQKINNWTKSRLDGYTMELGFGVGASFLNASDPAVNIADLTFDLTEDSAFSHGLFGPIDKHFLEEGFFSAQLAGYAIPMTPGNVGLTTFTSSSTVGEYSTMLGNQFGTWLPANWVPSGIFHDDDNDPSTDAVLKAWWGKDGTDGTFKWLLGQADSFSAVSDTQLQTWAADPLYAIDRIDDFANLNLNYVVNVGDPTLWPTWDGSSKGTFTIRVTPTASTDPAPEYTDTANQAPTTIYEEESGDTTTTPTTTSSGGGGSFNPLMLLMLIPLAGAYLRRRFN